MKNFPKQLILSIVFFIFSTMVGNAQCPTSITGFTTLGEFGTSKYFISNEVARPVDAQAVAESHGGYLAAISTQAENDFIQQGADGLTYIGLTDENTEGTFEWFNGEAFSYNNINPCGFCNANATNQDYGVIEPWGGGWSFSNFWNQRKYIMEIPCSGGNNNQLPDLTVSNVTNLPNSGEEGEVVFFNFDLNNIGNITVAGNYNINTYISTDAIFGTDDVLVGEVPTGDTPVGTTADVPAAITVPSLSDGDYYLIIVADALLEINELDENNNTIAVPFSIESNSNGSECAYIETYPISGIGDLKNLDYELDGDGLELTTILRSGPSSNYQYEYQTTLIDKDGNATGTSNVVLPTDNKSKFGDFGYDINFNTPTQYEVKAIDANGNNIWTQTIDLNSSDPNIQVVFGLRITEIDDHLIVSGYYLYDGMGTNWRPFLIKLDLNGNKIWESLLESANDDFVSITVYEEAIGGGYYLGLRSFGSSIDLLKASATGEQLWVRNMAGDLVSNNVKYGGQSPDGSAVFFGVGSVSNARADVTKVDANNGNTIWHQGLTTAFDEGDVGNTLRGIIPTSDGGVVVGGILYDFLNNESIKLYGRLDGNGNAVWHYPMPTDFPNHNPQIMTADGGFVFTRYNSVTKEVEAFKTTSEGLLTPLCNGGGSSDCPTSLSGFTSLGEFNGSAYFLSNEVARPTDAQAIAESNGGYLVVINSQDENDFIQQYADGLTYIGLTDENTEGNLEWLNGESISYNNVNPCGFCSANSDDLDYGVIQPWDGGWSFSNFWNQRKYIIEIPCNGGSGNGNNDCNFITTIGDSNFKNFIDFRETNDEYILEVKLNNSSFPDSSYVTTTVSKEGKYLSTSNSQYPNGTYYIVGFNGFEILLLTILEGNPQSETTYNLQPNDPANTEVTRTYALKDETGFWILGFYQLGVYPNATFGTFTIRTDLNGNFIFQNFHDAVFGSDVQSIEKIETSNDGGFFFTIRTSGNSIRLYKMAADGSLSWSKHLEGDLITNYVNLIGETSDASAIYVLRNFNVSTAKIQKFDAANGDIIWEHSLGLSPGHMFASGGVVTSDDAVVVSVSYEEFNFPFSEDKLEEYRKINSNGTEEWRHRFPLGFEDASPIATTSDGGIIFYTYEKLIKVNSEGLFDPACSNIEKPDLQPANIRRNDFPSSPYNEGQSFSFNFEIHNNSLTTIDDTYTVDVFLRPFGPFNAGTQDDIYVTSYDFSGTPYGITEIDESFIIPNVPPDSYRIVVTTDTDDDIDEGNEYNNLVFTEFSIKIEDNVSGGCPMTLSGFTSLGEFNGLAYFLSNEVARPTDAQSEAINNGGNLAIINSQAENDFLFQQINELVYIGINDASTEGTLEWVNGSSVGYTNFDICNFCNENTSEFDYAVMHGWNGGWSWSSVWNQRKYIVEIPCLSPIITPTVSNSLIAFPTNETNKLMLEKLMPNPANDFIFASIFSPSENNLEINILDARGVLVKTEIVGVHKGSNTIEININDLPSGFYMMQIPNAQIKTSTLRFVKSRD